MNQRVPDGRRETASAVSRPSRSRISRTRPVAGCLWFRESVIIRRRFGPAPSSGLPHSRAAATRAEFSFLRAIHPVSHGELTDF